jgi:hypothetical protein
MLAAVSTDGKLGAVLDRRSGKLQLYGIDGQKIREHVIEGLFGSLQVSDVGMVALYCTYSIDGERPNGESVLVMGTDGKAMLRHDNLDLGSTLVAFANGGRLAVVLSVVDGRLSCFLVTVEGEVSKQQAEPGLQPGELLASADGELIAFSGFKLAEPDTGLESLIYVSDLLHSKLTTITCSGTYVQHGQMALASDNKSVIVVGPAFVKSFDTLTGKLNWRRPVGHPEIGTIPVGAGVAVSTVGNKVVSTHRVPTGPGYRFLISVYDLQGNPQRLFVCKQGAEGQTRSIESMLTAELPHPSGPVRIWEVGEDGHSIEMKVEPKGRIELDRKG